MAVICILLSVAERYNQLHGNHYIKVNVVCSATVRCCNKIGWQKTQMETKEENC